jgi:uncharacterized protein HemY
VDSLAKRSMDKETALDISYALNNTLAAATVFLQLGKTEEAMKQLESALKHAHDLFEMISQPKPMNNSERRAMFKVSTDKRL